MSENPTNTTMTARAVARALMVPWPLALQALAAAQIAPDHQGRYSASAVDSLSWEVLAAGGTIAWLRERQTPQTAAALQERQRAQWRAQQRRHREKSKRAGTAADTLDQITVDDLV